MAGGEGGRGRGGVPPVINGVTSSIPPQMVPPELFWDYPPLRLCRRKPQTWNNELQILDCRISIARVANIYSISNFEIQNLNCGFEFQKV